jgi:hypothetical protein
MLLFGHEVRILKMSCQRRGVSQALPVLTGWPDTPVRLRTTLFLG